MLIDEVTIMVIHVVSTGRLVKDIHVSKTSTNKDFAYVDVACDSYNKGGPETIFFRIFFWDEIIYKIKCMQQFLKKGKLITFSGCLRKATIFDRKDGKRDTTQDINGLSINFAASNKTKENDNVNHINQESKQDISDRIDMDTENDYFFNN